MALRKKGLTYDQIGAELGTSGQVIKNAVYRAKQKGTSSHKRENLNKSDTKIEDLVTKYQNSLTSRTALKDENAGRATAVNTHIAQCMAIGKMVDVDNINSLYAAFETYIKLCAESDCPMNLISACVAIGVGKTALRSWSTQGSRADNPAYKEFADGVMFAIQAGIETCMSVGLINPVVGIWWEKAHFREIEADRQAAPDTAISALERKKTAQQIMDEYEGLELPE